MSTAHRVVIAVFAAVGHTMNTRTNQPSPTLREVTGADTRLPRLSESVLVLIERPRHPRHPRPPWARRPAAPAK